MNEQWANEFGLNHAQMRFIQDAIPASDEKGYSQALLGVDQFEHRIVVAILLVKLILGLVAVALFLL